MSDAEFELLRESDGRRFVKIYTGKTHYMVEITEEEQAKLIHRLTEPPTPFER